MKYALPDVTAFVDDMAEHWENTLGNTPNASLRATWKQLGASFGQAITESHEGTKRHWRVLQPATGTGKTQGLSLYLAHLALENLRPEASPTGALVVVQQIRQADDVRDTILRHLESRVCADLSGVVLAHHSQRPQSAEALRHADVLVITHAQYLKCIEEALRDFGAASDRWQGIISWTPEEGEPVLRRLTVIDEALDVVRHRKVSVADIGHASTYIPADVRERFPRQLSLLGRAEHVLRETAEANEAGRKGSVLWQEGPYRDALASGLSIEPLVEALEALPTDHFVPWSGRKDRSTAAATRTKVTSILRNAATLMAQWAFYYQVGRERSLNFSDLAVPLEMVNPVLMDATASHSALLRLFGDAVDIKPTPENARRYDNVTLRPAMLDGGTGKHAMKKWQKERAPLLFDSLSREVPAGSRVLIICHKDVRPSLEGYQLDGCLVEVAHYGALDGLNQWQDFDTVVLFGTYYRPRETAVASYFAATGGPDDRVFDGPKADGGYEDVLEAIAFGERMSTTIQAINRIRCRRVVDGQGHCAPATVFMVLPPNEAKEIIASLSSDMPGLVVGPDWDLSFRENPVSRRSHFDRGLYWLMDNLSAGRHSAKFVRGQLGMSADQWKKMAMRKLSDPEDPLTMALAAIGVTFETTGCGGRGGRSCLVKV